MPIIQHVGRRAILAFGVLLAQALAFGAESQRFSNLLRQYGGASDSELKLFTQSGAAFAEILPHLRPGGVAAAGAVRIPVPIDFYLSRFRDIEKFKKASGVLAIGRFSNPPKKQDLISLTLEDKALETLPACRPGKCMLKLSAEMIQRVHAFGRKPSLSALDTEFHSLLLHYAADYIKEGTSAMIAYSDSDPPVQSSKEFLDILGQFGWLEKNAPGLFAALRDSRRESLSSIESFLYWSKESFGLKPVASVTHVMIFRTTLEDRPWAFIASKQIYANHYFVGSLGLTVLAGDAKESARGSTSVAYFNRTRTDGLRGLLGSMERSVVERRLRAATVKNLSELSDRLAEAYRNRAR